MFSESRIEMKINGRGGRSPPYLHPLKSSKYLYKCNFITGKELSVCLVNLGDSGSGFVEGL